MSPAQNAAQAAAEPAPRPVPEARGLPLVGVAPQVAMDPLGALSRIASEHPGQLVALRFGPLKLYLVSHPRHAELMLQSHWRSFAKQGPMWQALRRLLGSGLIANEGAPWIASRRTLQPIFNHKYLASLTERMVATIERVLKELAERSGGARPVELFQEMNILTQSVILECLFDISIPREEAERLGSVLERAMWETNLRWFLPFVPEDFPVLGSQRLRRLVAQIDEGLQSLTRRWEQTRSPQSTSLLSLLQQAADPETGRGMSPQQVRDEVLTLWVAGSETTGSALTWTGYLLTQHPEVEARLREEVDQVLGGRTPTFADLEHLKYARQVFSESLRVYPPAWVIPRYSVKEEVVDGYTLPANALLLVSPYLIHRNPEFWPEPERFDPERFSAERSAGRPASAFMPFGLGPRHCLGEHFALYESLLTLAMMLQRFRLRLVPGQKIEPRSMASLRPGGPTLVTLEPR